MSAIGKTPPPAVPPLLTQREMMIVFLMSAGHTASEIAKLLEVRPRTVENRKRSIYEKLGVGNQSQAVAKAIWLGLLQPGPPPTLPRKGPAPQPSAWEPRRPLLAVLLGPASKGRDEVAQSLIAERVPLVVALDREELLRDHWVWWQRGPIVIVLVDPGARGLVGHHRTRCPNGPDPQQGRTRRTRDRRRAGPAGQRSGGVHRCLHRPGPILTTVAQGMMVLSWEYATALLKWSPSPSPEMPKLTAREYDILGSIARGHTIRQTARTLGIAAKTVENTQARLFRKLGVRNRMEALTIADALGLIDRAAAPPAGATPASQPLAGQHLASQPSASQDTASRDPRSGPGPDVRLPAGDGEPAFGPARPGHQHDRCDRRLRETDPSVDLRVAGRAGLEVTGADIGDDRLAVRPGPQAADDDPKAGNGLVPRSEAGTAGSAASTSPLIRTMR